MSASLSLAFEHITNGLPSVSRVPQYAREFHQRHLDMNTLSLKREAADTIGSVPGL